MFFPSHREKILGKMFPSSFSLATNCTGASGTDGNKLEDRRNYVAAGYDGKSSD
jgi:hypothetical protein